MGDLSSDDSDDSDSEEEQMEGNEEEEEVEQKQADDDGNFKDEDDDKNSDTVDSSDEDDDDEDDKDEEALNLEITHLKKTLAENPFHYDSHVSLISAFKKAGELQSLRAARESMASLFPLTPELWLKWIKDERSLDGERADVTGACLSGSVCSLRCNCVMYCARFCVERTLAESVAMFVKVLIQFSQRCLNGPLPTTSASKFGPSSAPTP